MDSQLIKALIDALAASDLNELEYSRDGATLRLVKRPSAGAASGEAQPPSHPAPAANTVPADATQPDPEAYRETVSDAVAMPNEFRAPMCGIVHLEPSPGTPSYVRVGDPVRAGQTLCLMEAMKVFNELRAERDGTIEAVLVQAGQEVEAGQALFLLKTSDV
jgi:acetyl-CoA carboxylase biotin carboxyl carrier protein